MPKFTHDRMKMVQLLLTLLVWLLLFTIPIFFGNFENGIQWEHVFKIWKEYSLLVAIFLINHFLLMPKLFLKGKRTAYFVAIFALVGAITVSLFFFQDIFTRSLPEPGPPAHSFAPHDFEKPEYEQPEFGENDFGPRRPRPSNAPRKGPKDAIPPFANILVMSILLIGFDSGLMFFSKWMQSEQNKLAAEKESIKNKMAFLQTQVSPHFFMNTLNNIHALVDIDTEEAKEAIIRLSQMMSYMLYESQTSNVSLQQEIEFIQSYVELMKLRFTDDVDIKVDIPETLPSVKIPPLLSISFIENAFKYGVSYEADSYIHIIYRSENNRLIMLVENSVHAPKVEKKNSGIGIKNARNRLDLIYANTYKLNIDNTDKTFKVNLNIPL